jgi:hypothetical protein|tara:strand:+ start:1725 stop:2159 length:435 start_codon:yes stop_codon:yes gene_type:complete
MSKEKAIGFQLVDITTEQFAMVKENYTKETETSLKTGIDFKIDIENNIIGCDASFIFSQEEKMFLLLEVGCHFNVKKKDWEGFETDGKLVVPKYFLEHLAVLTIGTARGVMFAKTENTQFSQFIVPTINVTLLIKEDGIFMSEE